MDYNKILPIDIIQPSVHIVNYFTLEKIPEVWGPRSIDDFEMILIREGRFSYREEKLFENSFITDKRVEGKIEIFLEPGDVLIIPPGVEHVFQTESDSGAISCIHNDPFGSISCSREMFPLSREMEYLTDFSDQMDLIDNLFFRANELFESYQVYREELLSTLCKEIWLRSASQWSIQSREEKVTDRMRLMLDYIKSNCKGKITRNDIAEEFGLSAEYVNSLFKTELNMTPSACINRERIRSSYVLIYNEGLSVKEAAYECGFKDPFYFSKVFKKEMGVSPSSLRKK